MKKLKFILIFFYLISFGQVKDTLQIKDIEIPNTPALTILDKSFSIIESVSSSNSISANLINVKDNTLEITPYWFFKEKKHLFTQEEYYGIKDDSKQNIFVNIKKMAFSVGYVPTDTLSSISFGFRTNLISVKQGKKSNSAMILYNDYIKNREEYINGIEPGESLNRLQLELTKVDNNIAIAKTNLSNQYDKQKKELKEKLFKKINNYYSNPIFSFDVAGAVSTMYPDNNTEKGRLGRLGIWATTKLNLPLEENYKNFLKIYLLGRVINDRTIWDASTSSFTKKNYIDTGGKIEFQFNNISISSEFVSRAGDVKDTRIVGMIDYKINDSICLSGGYGKNFESPINGNLIALFGLKWGLFKEQQVKLTY